MKTPEEIALIGGGILLSSGLVFGLKSGAASELPNVERSVGTVLQGSNSTAPSNSSTNQESAQQQQADKFNDGFQQAQKKGWQTGQWGSAKFYVDDNENMHVSGGQLQSPLDNVMGTNSFTNLKTITFDEPVKAPQDSNELISIGNTSLAGDNLTAINNLSNLDTSQTTNMYGMFSFNNSLPNLDLSHFDTHNVTNMDDMVASDSSLTNLNLSKFDTANVTNMESMFYEDSSLSNLDLSHFDTANVTNMGNMFYDDNIQQLTLGSNTKLSNDGDYNSSLTGTYQNNGQTLNLDGNAHPGTWTKQ